MNNDLCLELDMSQSTPSRKWEIAGRGLDSIRHSQSASMADPYTTHYNVGGFIT